MKTNKLTKFLKGITKVVGICIGGVVVFAYWFINFDEPRNVSKLFPDKFTVVSHRGETGRAPENTLAAFKIAVAEKFPIELDTFSCKSGELIILHDYTLDRTTNAKGKASELTLEELKKLDAGSHFSEKFKNERIPTMKEVMETIASKVPLIIEVKVESSGEEMIKIVDHIIKFIDDYKVSSSVIVSAFNPMVLKEFKKKRPEILRALLYSDFNTEPYLSPIVKFALKHRLLRRLADPDVLMPQERIVTKKHIKEQQKKGYKVMPWTINDTEVIHTFIEYGVDGLITDRPLYVIGLI